jgi:hypothetical protein
MNIEPSKRHDDADTRLVSIERSDAIDAAAGLLALADKYRKQARARRNAGSRPGSVAYRAWCRSNAETYEAAARRVQRAADEAI